MFEASASSSAALDFVVDIETVGSVQRPAIPVFILINLPTLVVSPEVFHFLIPNPQTALVWRNLREKRGLDDPFLLEEAFVTPQWLCMSQACSRTLMPE